MPLPNEGPPLCANCEKRRATEEYTRAGRTFGLCAVCFDRWNLQDELEDTFSHVLELARRRKQYDEALASLDTFWEANRHRDHDGWLARSIAASREMVLTWAGRHAEALQVCEAWGRLEFPDAGDRWEHAMATAQALDALGRTREAVPVIEDALRYEDPKYVPSAHGLLYELARISEKLGQPVDPKWRRIAEAEAERFGVDMPAGDSLGQAILALRELTRSREPKRPHE